MKYRSRLLSLAFLIASLSLLGGCAHPKPVAKEEPLADVGYVDVDALPNNSTAVNGIRQQALSDTASMLGARGALAWRAERINAILETEATSLSQVFDFNQLLLKHNVLPPVIEESQGNLNLDNNETIRTADKVYKLMADARFATAPPTWRNYLWLDYKKPNIPDNSLLPQTKAEAEIWNFYLKQGWQNGLQQANDIFEANLSRLKRDYLGMVLYRKLLAQGMITSPIVSKAELGVTGDEKQLRINDEIMRITARAALQPNSSSWQPVITKGDQSS